MKKTEYAKSLFPLFLLSSIGAGLFFRQLSHFTLSNYVVENRKIPISFDGFRILQISDLHNNKLLCYHGKMLSKIRSLAPDSIFITGDIVDSIRTDYDVAVKLARELTGICPVFYTPGNHEARLAQHDVLFRQLKLAGVNVLLDRRENISRGGDRLSVAGVMDPRFSRNHSKYISNSVKTLLRLRTLRPLDENLFNILLAHRPESLAIYADEGYDLVFSGHAHGGQWRIPAFGPVFAPGQGLFPEYTSGVHSIAQTTLVVSRGLGNSEMPIRINNPFELVLVTLKHK